MSDWPKEELDKLFQQGAEGFNFHYNPGAWKKMEKLLDKERRRWLIIWWFTGISLLLLGICIFLTGTIYQESKALPSSKSGQVKTELPDDGLEPGQASKQKTLRLNKEQNTSSLIETDPKPAVKPKSTIGAPPSKSQSSLINKKLVNPGTDTILLDKKITTQNLFYHTDSTKANPQSQQVQVADLSFLHIDSIRLLDDIIRPFISPPLTLVKPKQLQENEFAIGALVAGETVSAGIDHFADLSWKVGIHAEYRFKRKFGIALGANYVEKKYRADAGDYTPPRGFWTRMIAPTSTTGSCNILELPVEFFYYSNTYRQSGFYAGASIVSFFMLEEHYHYNYNLPDPDLIRYWGGINASRHWMSMGQVSMGYNKFLAKQMYLQIAPYIQMPISGVGHGKVKLYSIGTNLRLKFAIQ